MSPAKFLLLALSVLLLPAIVYSEAPPPEPIQWKFQSDLTGGRKIITDGSIILESQYLPGVPLPGKNLPAPNVQRLLDSPTDREFGSSDLEQKGPDGHFVAPGPLQLNRKYIDLLRGTSLKSSLRFRAKGPLDPVLILDGQKVVGAMMPMKM